MLVFFALWALFLKIVNFDLVFFGKVSFCCWLFDFE